MDNDMRALLLIILIVTSSNSVFGATKVEDPMLSMPMHEMFWSLFQERNILGVNDCTNKSGRYAKALIAGGYDAEIIIVRPDRGQYRHAIVRVTNKQGLSQYLDPTKGLIAYNPEFIGTVLEVIPTAQIANLGSDYK